MSTMRFLTEQQLLDHQKRLGKARKVTLLAATRKGSKHRSVKTVVDGIEFDSKLEAEQYQLHQLRQKAGDIAGLRRQVKFSLFGKGGEHIGVYRADLVFDERQKDGAWLRIVADVKSSHTKKLAAWARTKKLLRACHGIEVRELP